MTAGWRDHGPAPGSSTPRTLNIIQAVYNLGDTPAPERPYRPGSSMPVFLKQIERASANGMGVLVIRGPGGGRIERRSSTASRRRHDRRAHRFGPRQLTSVQCRVP